MSASIARPRGSGWMHADARRGLSAILASGERWMAWAALVLYLLGMAAPLFGSKGAKGGVLLFVATFCAWLLLFARPLATAWQMERMRMPGAVRTLRLALSMALGMSVVLPGAAFALGAGIPVLDGIALLACAAMLGLMIAWLPGRIAWALCFLPSIWLWALDDASRAAWGEALQGMSLQALCGVVALVAASVAWLSARTLLAFAQRDALPAWRQPQVLWWAQQRAQTTGAHGGWVANADVTQTYRNTPEWLSGINRTADFGVARRSPVVALRAWLGSPYAPLHPRDRARQLLFVFGSLLLYPLLMAGVLGGKATWKALLLLGGGFAVPMLVFLFAFMFPMALLQRRLRASAEYAELALLPALGDARENLPRAVAGPLLAFAAGLAALCLVLLALAPQWQAAHAGIALGWLATVAIVASGCLRALAGQSVGLAWNAGLLVLMLVLAVATAVQLVPKLAGFLPAGAAMWVNLGWLLAAVAYAALGWQAWRRYRALPHPFLQD